MTKKNKITLGLVVLVLITSLFIGNTIARYVTSSSSEDEARVAIWGINGETVTMELFNTEYDANGTLIAESNDGDKIIAPGTSRSSAFSIMDINSTIAPEVMYEIGINLDDSEIAPEILANPSVQWKLDDNSWGTWEECKEDILNLTGSTGGKKVYAPNTLPNSFSDGQEHTIAWQWLMDNGTDEEDTAMGNAAVDGDLTAKIKISVTAKQVDFDATGMLEGNGSIYNTNDPQPLTFRADDNFEDFETVKVNGAEINEGTDYIAESSSIKITLNKDYLKTLSKGKYVISIISSNKETKAQFNVEENTTIVHNNVIPEGATYYQNAGTLQEDWYYYIQDYSNATVYESGDKFPSPQTGDVYVYGDYEYKYNYFTDLYVPGVYVWCENSSQNGWGVRYIGDSLTTPKPLLTRIANKDLVNMNYSFGTTNFKTSPIIPETVKYMNGTYEYSQIETAAAIPQNVNSTIDIFLECPKLTGTIEINTPKFYNRALVGTNITWITGSISDALKNEIANASGLTLIKPVKIIKDK